MKIHTVTTYDFAELNDKAKAHAIDKLRDLNVDHADWHEATFEDAKTCAKLIGIDISCIYYTGFWSQGDGACFDGSYSYAKGGAAALKEHAPLDTELHRIATELQTLQRGACYGLCASTKHRGHYYHDGCMEIDVGDSDRCPMTNEQEQELKDLLRSFARWTYAQLEREYIYLTSDESVRECIEANEYQFDTEGNLSRLH